MTESDQNIVIYYRSVIVDRYNRENNIAISLYDVIRIMGTMSSKFNPKYLEKETYFL